MTGDDLVTDAEAASIAENRVLARVDGAVCNEELLGEVVEDLSFAVAAVDHRMAAWVSCSLSVRTSCPVDVEVDEFVEAPTSRNRAVLGGVADEAQCRSGVGCEVAESQKVAVTNR
jgi:hypothetical protein